MEPRPRLHCAQSAIFYWQQFATDERLRSIAPYFEIKRLQNVFRRSLCRWLLGRPNLEFLETIEILRPRLLMNYGRYMIKLRRVRI
jgi:hypothetical protein